MTDFAQIHIGVHPSATALPAAARATHRRL
eukprot:COSAG03_NODE_26756_length_257_cov_0.651899_1_plen_29_part_01